MTFLTFMPFVSPTQTHKQVRLARALYRQPMQLIWDRTKPNWCSRVELSTGDCGEAVSWAERLKAWPTTTVMKGAIPPEIIEVMIAGNKSIRKRRRRMRENKRRIEGTWSWVAWWWWWTSDSSIKWVEWWTTRRTFKFSTHWPVTMKVRLVIPWAPWDSRLTVEVLVPIRNPPVESCKLLLPSSPSEGSYSTPSYSKHRLMSVKLSLCPDPDAVGNKTISKVPVVVNHDLQWWLFLIYMPHIHNILNPPIRRQ